MKIFEVDPEKDKLEDVIGEMLKKLKKDLLDELPEEKLQVVTEKIKLKKENEEASKKMEEVTHNTYVEIGKYINEYIAEDTMAMRRLYDKCKKWLDDNNKPYREDFDDEDDD